MQSGTARTVGCLALAVAVVAAIGVGVFWWLRDRGLTEPVPGQQRCVATAKNSSVVLDLEQAHYASIIAGVSVRRGLPPRAASIALATAYQETGIRNLNYGDRDSVGLFQQRPSQGWGSKRQLLDPDYASERFYDALVKIKNWETDDINDLAQKVQRSGHPEAYRDHEADAPGARQHADRSIAGRFQLSGTQRCRGRRQGIAQCDAETRSVPSTTEPTAQ